MNYEDDPISDLEWQILREWNERIAQRPVKPVPGKKTVVDGLIRGMAELDQARIAA